MLEILAVCLSPDMPRLSPHTVIPSDQAMLMDMFHHKWRHQLPKLDTSAHVATSKSSPRA